MFAFTLRPSFCSWREAYTLARKEPERVETATTSSRLESFKKEAVDDLKE